MTGNRVRAATRGLPDDHRALQTFRALTELADWQAPVNIPEKVEPKVGEQPKEARSEQDKLGVREAQGRIALRELHYNIQIVLPETRDVAVFDAIFEALQKHLLR